MGFRTFFAIVLTLPLTLPVRAGAEEAAGHPPARVRIAGSRLILPLAEAWARELAGRGIAVEAEGRGSSTGPPALLGGRADVASMSRPLLRAELDAFRHRVGRDPTAIPFAVDAVAVLVNPRNPLERLSLAELDAIFSMTRYCGAAAPVGTWGELGLDGEWAPRGIGLYGAGWSSERHALMRAAALCGGLFRAEVRETPGGSSAVKAIAESRYGIGYCGRGDVTAEVKVLALARASGEAYVAPTDEKIASGEYPLSRRLLLYVSATRGGTLEPAVVEFIRYVLSEQGRTLVEQHGYVPPPLESVEASLAALSD
jgi:phosphate transport system substrate-binding protein